MSTKLLAAVIVLLILASCSQDPVAPGNRIDTLVIRDTVLMEHPTDTNSMRLKGNLHGKAKLYSYSGPLSDYSGITVSIDGTSYSSLTDISGEWTIHDLLAGTYNITFSKPGFDTIRVFSYQFVGGGDVYWVRPYASDPEAHPTLPLALPDQIIVSNFRQDRYSPKEYLAGEILPSTSSMDVQVFVGRDSMVSSALKNYVRTYRISTNSKGMFGDSAKSYPYISNRISYTGFQKGDTMFMTAYPIITPTSSYADSYWNPQYQQYVYIGIGKRRSNVLRLVVP